MRANIRQKAPMQVWDECEAVRSAEADPQGDCEAAQTLSPCFSPVRFIYGECRGVGGPVRVVTYRLKQLRLARAAVARE